MSLLTATIDDVSPRGRLLPEGEYVVTVEEAKAEQRTNGVQWSRRYGNIRNATGATEFLLPDGNTFRIGNRKLFNRSWIKHTNPDAQRIGNTEIMKEAISATLADKPEKGKPSTLMYDLETEDGQSEYASALAGRDVKVRVRHRTRQEQVNGKPVTNEDGSPKMVTDAEIADYLAI